MASFRHRVLRALGQFVVLAAISMLGAGGLLMTAGPAHALSCADPREVMERADHVFAGRIIDSADGSVLVEVDEVWSGGPVQERVWLQVGLLEWSGLAEDGELPDGLSRPDRTVFAESGAIDSTGPCSMWGADDELVVDQRPATVSSPVPGESERPAPLPADGVDHRLVGLAGFGAVLVCAGGYWLLSRRRRDGQPATTD